MTSESPANIIPISDRVVGNVLVVDDHAPARTSIADILRQAGHRVRACGSAVEGLKVLDAESFDVVLTDLKMPGMNGVEFIQAIDERDIDVQVVMVTAYASVSSAVDAMRYGAFDYLEKPLQADALESLVARAILHGRTEDRHTAVPPTTGRRSPVLMIGSSRAMQSVRQRIAQVAPTDETVLITGESGTGKELVARGIHATSRRAQQAMISLNCPVLAENLMESELFGHERGAFTSADAPRVGRFELADRGTILLDEVTEIALPLQAKLLRVLQEKNFERIGASCTTNVDVRVLATTNRDLRSYVEEGSFREDLYFRLAVLPIHVPALRERPTDIPELADHFVSEATRRTRCAPCEFSDAAYDLLQSYTWPGNVRELQNIVTRATVLRAGDKVAADEIRPWLLGETKSATTAAADIQVGMTLHKMEQQLILSTLEHFDGHRQKTAKALGIGVRTLSGKLRNYGLAPRAKTAAKAA
jgi:DNA-binding NtrC family response regulator